MIQRITSLFQQKKSKLPEIPETLSEKVKSLQKEFILISFNYFYRFCFFWSLLCFTYFILQSILQESQDFLLLILVSFISCIVYLCSLFFYASILEKNYRIVIVLSSWLLCLNQFLFIQSSPYQGITALHTVSGITYGLFIALFLFLPDWKLTAYSSLGPLAFLLYHYSDSMGLAWSFGEHSGIVNEFYLVQLFLEIGFFLVITVVGSKRKDEKNKAIRKVFLRKTITEPHLRMMDTAIQSKKIHNWIVTSKYRFSESFGGADMILVENHPSGNLVIAIGDVVGHGLDVSHGSFVACVTIRSLILSGETPRYIFNVTNNMLNRLKSEDGGELFLQLIFCDPFGNIQIYGHPAGETRVNETEINQLFVILGKERDFLKNNKIDIIPFTKKLKKGETVFSCTDGWIGSDEDDKSFVHLKYVGN